MELLRQDNQTESNGIMRSKNSESELLPQNLQSLVARNTFLQQALESPELSLVHYKSTAQAAFIKAHMMELILNMVGMVNVGKTMNAKQIEFAAKMIVEDSEFKQLKPCEIETMFQNGITGKYGKLYDRIDVSVFFEWKEKFLDQRWAEIMKYREEEKKEYHNITSKLVQLSPLPHYYHRGREEKIKMFVVLK